MESPRVLGQELSLGFETRVRIPVLRRQLQITAQKKEVSGHDFSLRPILGDGTVWSKGEGKKTYDQTAKSLSAARIRHIGICARRA